MNEARWTMLFTNRKGKPIKAIKKGFVAACERAEIQDLRPYDLRHVCRSFARVWRTSLCDFRLARSFDADDWIRPGITPGYAHATWEVMVKAVENLEQPLSTLNTFAIGSSGQSIYVGGGQAEGWLTMETRRGF